MALNDIGDRERLLKLGEAAKYLGITESTLRNWADTGKVISVRTPGGHRRFHWDDLQDLANQLSGGRGHDLQELEEQALVRIQERLQLGEQSQEEWLTRVNPETLPRFRIVGRRLLSLFIRTAIGTGSEQQDKEEAWLIGREQGAEIYRSGTPLMEALSVFVSFRNAALNGLPSDSWSQVLALCDRAMLGIVEAYGGPTEESKA